MKKVLHITILAFLAFLAFLALVLWVRLAPSNPAIWHVALADQTAAVAGPCRNQIRIVPTGARATCLPLGDPATVLTHLDTAARAAPRTSRLAGTPQTGMITWISRSPLVGFPDYITAEVHATPQGTRLDIFSRQRFGQGDHGVNAARLKAWLAGL